MADDDFYYYDPDYTEPTDGANDYYYGDPSQAAPGASGGDWLSGLLSGLGNIDPKGLIGALLGAAGPIAGLAGNLISGGQTGSQSQNSNSSLSGSTSGFNNTNQSGFTNTQQTGSSNTVGTTNQTQNTNQSGFNNTTSNPILDPRAGATADRLNQFLGGGFGNTAQGAYTDALSMLKALVAGGSSIAASAPSAPNTTPRPAAVTGFTTQLPSEIDQGLVNLIKQAFSGFTGDIAKSAITNARARGFAGGADLLQTAAAPIAGEALARVPAEQAKAYLEQALARYVAQNNAAAQKAGAEAGALNAATNALQPGVSAYGADVNRYLGELNAGNQQIAAKGNLIQAMMDPLKTWMSGNISLLNALPHGTQTNSLSGMSGTQTLSGTNTTNQNSASVTNSASGSNTQSNSGGTTNQNQTGSNNNQQSQPIGNVVGTGIGNIIGGGAQGYANMTAPPTSASLLRALLGA